jgi:hypothetical protein
MIYIIHFQVLSCVQLTSVKMSILTLLWTTTPHLRVVTSTARRMAQACICSCLYSVVAQLLCNPQNIFMVWDGLRKVPSVVVWWSKVAVCPSLFHLQHHHNFTFKKPQEASRTSRALCLTEHTDSQIFTKDLAIWHIHFCVDVWLLTGALTRLSYHA